MNPLPPMSYRESHPGREFANRIAGYWEFAVSDRLQSTYMHSVPVDGSVSIGLRRSNESPPGCFLVGPRLSNLQVPVKANDLYWGIRLLPGACRSIIGIPGIDLFDRVVPLFEISPELDRTLYKSLTALSSFVEIANAVEEALAASPGTERQPDNAVSEGVTEIVRSQGAYKIAELAQKVGYSERQFLRLFRTEVGITPKQFARICRLRTAAIDALDRENPVWGEIAAQRGYADQAHFVHEFNTLFGMTPSEFQRVFLQNIAHGEFRRDD